MSANKFCLLNAFVIIFCSLSLQAMDVAKKSTKIDAELSSDICEAIKSINTELAKTLIKKAVSEHNLNTLNKRDRDGMRPLHLAAIRNMIDIVELLVESGVKIGVLNREQLTPLDVAVKEGNMEIASYLLIKGAQYSHDTTELISKRYRTPREFVHTPRGTELLLKTVQDFLLDKQKAHSLIFAYPLIMNDKTFFRTLSTLASDYREGIVDVLKDLAENKFPNGAPSTEAIKELKQLLRNLKVHAESDIHRSLFQNLAKKTPRTQSIKLPNRQTGSENTSKDAEKIAYVIAKLNQDSFKVLSFKEIYAWLRNHKRAPNIHCIGNQFNNIVTYVAIDILSGKEKEEQIRKVKKYIKVAKILLKQNNFQGVFQVLSALGKADIERLKIIPEKSKKLHKLADVIKYDSNYANYRARLANAFKKDEPIVPSIPVLLTDLIHANEGFGEEHIDTSMLAAAAEQLRYIYYMQRKPNYNFDVDKNLHYLLSNLSHFADETIIEEYSELRLKGFFGVKRNNKFKSKKSCEWNSNEFINFLIQSSSDYQLHQEILFSAGIYNGKILCDILSAQEDPKEHLRILKFDDKMIEYFLQAGML